MALFGLGACGGSDESSDIAPSAKPSATASSSTSGDPVAPASVKPTRPEDVNSEQGARDFSVFVMQNVVYAISTNDVDPLLALSDGDSCRTCVSLAQANRKRGDVVQVPTGDTVISDISTEKRDATSFVVRQVLEFPKVEITDLKSKEVTDTSAAADLDVTAVVVWKNDKWALENYGTKEAR